MTEPLSRTSVLADRHKALGSGLEDWNGMGTAWTYASDPDDEHDAVRERVGMFDMSPLKKIFVRGPDAAAVLEVHSRPTPRSHQCLCMIRRNRTRTNEPWFRQTTQRVLGTCKFRTGLIRMPPAAGIYKCSEGQRHSRNASVRRHCSGNC